MQIRSPVLGGLLLLALLAAGVVAVAPQIGPGIGGNDAAFEESELASFTATEPTCADPRSSNASTVVRPADGGTRVSFNDTIPVESRDTRVDADLDEFGPGRYVLDVQRSPGDGPADCHLEVRYNATLNLTESTEYTVVLTFDDRLVGIQWSTEGASGMGRTAGAADPKPGADGEGGSATGGTGSGAGGADDSTDSDRTPEYARTDGSSMRDGGRN